MALYYDLPVFKDVYQLIMKIFDYTKGGTLAVIGINTNVIKKQ